MNTNENLLEPLNLIEPPDQWDEIVERVRHQENQLSGVGCRSDDDMVWETAAEAAHLPSSNLWIAPLLTAAAVVAVIAVGVSFLGSRSSGTRIVTVTGTPGTQQPASPPESSIGTAIATGLPECTLNDRLTSDSTGDVLASMSFTHAVGLISLIDSTNTSGRSREDVVSTLRKPYVVELAVGDHDVSNAPEDSDLGTAYWELEIDTDGTISTRSFVVDSFKTDPDEIDLSLPSGLLADTLEDVTGDTAIETTGTPDCTTVIADMRPVTLTIAVAGPDIQYAAAVAYRVGNVLAGPR